MLLTSAAAMASGALVDSVDTLIGTGTSAAAMASGALVDSVDTLIGTGGFGWGVGGPGGFGWGKK